LSNNRDRPRRDDGGPSERAQIGPLTRSMARRIEEEDASKKKTLPFWSVDKCII